MSNRITIDFHKRLARGEVPISYITVHTHMGYRAYAEKELAQIFELAAYLADGSHLADGSITAGGDTLGIIDKAARVVSFGTFERSLQSMKDDVLGSYQSKTLQKLAVTMDNADGYFARLIASEPFISRALKYWVGFEAEPQSNHLNIFSGVISELSALTVMIIEADER